MTVDLAALRQAAQRFREAIEVGGLQWKEFDNFPRGSCGVTSELLGEYLRETGFGDWRIVRGTHNAPDAFRSHAWLERDGVYIDITGDQFGQEPIIVSSTPLWVGQFQGSPRHVAGPNYYPLYAVEIRNDYQTIVRRVREGQPKPLAWRRRVLLLRAQPRGGYPLISI